MYIIYTILTLYLPLFFSQATYVNRGCCSYHGGIDYCDVQNERWVCRDGTYSKSCGCNENDNIDSNNILIIENNYSNEKLINNSEYSEDNDSKYILNFAFAIIIGIITYLILIKMKYRPPKIKNKIIKKINNILYIVIVCLFGWITIPVLLGSEEFYLIEIISIIIILYITYNSE